MSASFPNVAGRSGPGASTEDAVPTPWSGSPMRLGSSRDVEGQPSRFAPATGTGSSWSIGSHVLRWITVHCGPRQVSLNGRRVHYPTYSFVGSEEAPRRTNLRPPLKLDVQFSRIQLSQRHACCANQEKESVQQGSQVPSCHRAGIRATFSTRMTAIA